MKRFILAFSTAAMLLAPFAVRCEVTDKIVAIVNDDVITLREVERFVAVEKRSRYTSMNEYVRSIALREKLDAFVENTLIMQQARKLKMVVDEKDVDAAVEDIKKRNMISESELKEQLKRENIRYDDFVEGIKMSLTRNRVLSRALSQEVNVDDKRLKEYYDAHADEYTDEEFRIQHIFVSKQRKDAAARAREAWDALEKGKAFGDVAKEYSDESSKDEILTTNRADLIPELRQGLQLLLPGSYSSVVQTPYGYHILKLIEVKKGARASFDELKDKIKAAIYQQESEKRYKEYMSKLKSVSYIEVKI
jgi:peptidyl-prolyl cis-trans isomerase SurA